MIKTVLEDVADNLFNPDPYYQQGGDMVRVGGLTYTMTPGARMGARVDDLRLNGKPLEADKTYKVAGWAPVSEDARTANTRPVRIKHANRRPPVPPAWARRRQPRR
jgi:sulfur-oxidizing protein SoxB